MSALFKKWECGGYANALWPDVWLVGRTDMDSLVLYLIRGVGTGHGTS